MTTIPARRTAQQVVFDFLDPTDAPPLERAFNALLSTLILTNIALTIWATVPGVHESYAALLNAFSSAAFAVFSAEYLGRLYVAPLKYPHLSPAYARLKWAFTPLAMVDLVVLFALGVPTLADWAALKAARLLKLLSLLKLGRYSSALTLIGDVIRARRDELVMTGVIVVILVLFSATLLYHAESTLGNKCFESIPATAWWAIVTLTSTGYGDCTPTSPLGKLFAALSMFIGIGLVALPTAIIAGSFSEALARQREQACCPHCGQTLER